MKLFYTQSNVIEIWKHHLKCDPLKLFFARKNLSEYYHDVVNSVEILEKLIMFQYNCENKAREFLNDLLDIAHKRILKCNCLFFLSAPNSGKSFFMDSFIHFLVNFGLMAN